MLWNLFNRMPKPFDEGNLPTTDGHRIHYYQYGNPVGIPVLSFHGGPGGESRPKYAKLFDLKRYRFLQFDQRGCGLSQAGDLLFRNETAYLLQDAMHLLAYLHINEPIVVHGNSWGSTLALLFAEAYPKLVRRIIVSAIFLARFEDYMWVKRDSERFYPDLWQEMRRIIPQKNFFEAYNKLLFSENEADYLSALSSFGSYEYKLGQLNPSFTPLETATANVLNSARIYAYYDRNRFFINENQILRNIDKIKNIPIIIAHNRMDFCCPPKQAWDLYQAIPQADFCMVADYGHSTPKLLKKIKKLIKTSDKK
ncbi:MAG: alpha/beta fold hydrolase [Alphaproteobacteria bacterium]|nr:alpha/beta fold hydrolase [Alphaproteobacteria bacterium]